VGAGPRVEWGVWGLAPKRVRFSVYSPIEGERKGWVERVGRVKKIEMLLLKEVRDNPSQNKVN